MAALKLCVGVLTEVLRTRSSEIKLSTQSSVDVSMQSDIVLLKLQLLTGRQEISGRQLTQKGRS